ncbi:MAG: A/G-specific adenine glycosylase [Bacteroidota bacterium]
MKNNPFTTAIVRWYNRHKRPLPWRNTTDPYFIWLSEIILQQTRVVQGLPYYKSFTDNFPGISDLAKAKEETVLRLWQGLGYYTRARNLHKCAKVIVEDYNGKFPSTMKELLKLPGVGKYTAAAIASLAYDEVVPVIDGNVYRLLSRYFADETDISSSKAYNHFYHLATQLIDENDPGTFNQAMMEFGAVHCVPQNPDCDTCVLQEKCMAHAHNLQNKLPVKTKRVKTKKRYLFYLIVKEGNKILMRERKEKDIWRGLYEFVLVESTSADEFDQLEHPILENLKDVKINLDIIDKNVRHVLTHQHLNVKFAIINVKEGQEISEKLSIGGYRWYSLEEVEKLPKPILISNFLDTYLNSINLQK